MSVTSRVRARAVLIEKILYKCILSILVYIFPYTSIFPYTVILAVSIKQKFGFQKKHAAFWLGNKNRLDTKFWNTCVPLSIDAVKRDCVILICCSIVMQLMTIYWHHAIIIHASNIKGTHHDRTNLERFVNMSHLWNVKL